MKPILITILLTLTLALSTGAGADTPPTYLPIVYSRGVTPLSVPLAPVYQQPGYPVTSFTRHTGRLFAGLRDTRLIYSTDNGQTWPGSIAITPSFVNDLVTLPDNTMLAGGFNFAEDGTNVLIRSTDGGNTWTDVTPTGMLEVEDLATVTGGTVLAGGLSHTVAASLWRSTDGGLTWTAVLPAQGNGTSFGAILVTGGNLWAMVRSGDVYRSTNGGVGWNLVGTAPYGGFRLLGFAGGQVAAVNHYTGVGFNVSTNGGITWNNTGAPYLFLSAVGVNGTVYAVRQGNPQQLILSIDTGATWENAAVLGPPGPGAPFRHGMYRDPVTNRLLVGTGDGTNSVIYLSDPL